MSNVSRRGGASNESRNCWASTSRRRLSDRMSMEFSNREWVGGLASVCLSESPAMSLQAGSFGGTSARCNVDLSCR